MHTEAEAAAKLKGQKECQKDYPHLGSIVMVHVGAQN